MSLKTGPRGSQSRGASINLNYTCIQAVKRRSVKYSASVMSSHFGICTWVGVATALAYARVIYHGIHLQEFVRHMPNHVYTMLLIQGNPISKMSAEYMLYRSCES